jgi:hypothetical protein
MANHTITVINKNAGSGGSGGGGSKSKKKKSTSSLEKFKMKNIRIDKIKATGTAAIAAAVISSTANTFFSIGAAATGEEMKYSNYRATLGAVINPVGFMANYVKRATLDEQKIDRQNISLNYQRQLTGSLVYSEKFNNGTF